MDPANVRFARDPGFGYGHPDDIHFARDPGFDYAQPPERDGRGPVRLRCVPNGRGHGSPEPGGVLHRASVRETRDMRVRILTTGFN